MATTDFVVKNGLVVTENAVVNGTTDASSKDTGALVIEGGLGVEKKLYVGTDFFVGSNTTLTGDLAVNGGDITTNQTTFNLLNTTSTTVNFAGAATTLNLGAATGTTNIKNNLNVTGDLDIDGGDLTVSTGTFNLANTTATTVNFAGASTALTIGATTGTTTIRNATTTITGNANINGGTLATSQGTFNLLNTTVTTGNLFGAGTAVTIGATTGTTTIRNANTVVTGDLAVNGGDITSTATTFNLLNTTVTAGNLFGAGTAVTIGSTSGTTTIRNATTTITGNANVNGGTLATSQGTFNLLNTTATTVNAFGATTTLNLGATSGTGTTSIKNAFKADGSVELGSTSVNSITVNSGTVNVPNSILVTKDDAVADNISYPILLRHTTSGVPTVGIGTGIQFITETSNNNNRTGAIIESVSTSVVNGSENFDLVFKLMTNGAVPTEKIRFTSTGNITVNGGLSIGSGDLTTTQSTFNLINTTATTINFGGAATAINIGATTGTTDIKNNLNVTGDLDIDGGDLTVSTSTFNLADTTATTVNFARAATTLTIGATTGTATIRNANVVLDGDLDVRGGDIITNQTAFNLINTTATTLNIGGAGTALTIGATTGTTTIRNATTTITGNANVNGGTLASTQTTFNLLNTTTSTVNFAGAGAAVTIGATTGTTTIRNATTTITGNANVNGGTLGTTATTFNLLNTTVTTGNLFGAAPTITIGAAGSAGVLTIRNDNVVLNGDIAVNGGDITTNQTTFNLIDATATTVNFARAGTAITIGATTGTTTIRNATTTITGNANINGGTLATSQGTFNLLNTTVTTGNLFGAGTAITIGATTGTTTIRNATVTMSGNANINGGTLGTTATTFNLVNATASTVNFAGAGTAVNIGATTGTTTIRNNLAVNGNTTIGDASGDGLTINSNTIDVPNTVTFTKDDAVNNSVAYPVIFRHTTSGTPAIGIGTGIQLVTETSNNNNEIGSTIESVATTVTGTAENFDLIFKTMSAGATPVERVKVNSSTVAINTGLVELSNASSNRLQWNTAGVAAPTFTTRSAGTKLVLYPSVAASAVDYGLGIENNTLWSSVPTTSSQFKWYGGTTQAMLLSGAGNLTLTGNAAVNGGSLTTSQTTFNLVNTTATTINFGGAADTLNVGKLGGNIVIAGNLVVNGTTTTINATELTVDDINIELGSIANPTNITADGGGITLKGTTDKTFNWVNATASWTSSEHINLLTGKTYKINGTDVLTATTLGSGVINSSLTTVGTIGTGIWQGTIISPTYGGTGVNNGSRTITLGGNFTHSGAHNLTLTTTANTNVTLPTTGTLATTGNLSQFASTTSAQLAGVISDETGTGLLVFNTSPTFATGVLTNSASFDVFNATATTVNAFGAATTLNVGNTASAQTVNIGTGSTGASTYNLGTGATATATTKTLNIGTGGAAGSTTNINIGSSVAGSTTVNSGTLVGVLATQNLFNTTATTLNIGGASTAFNAGATSGTMTLRNPTIVGSQTTQNLFDTVATTVNFAGAATAVNIGATTGTTTIRNATVTMSGNANINGGTLGTTQGTFNLLNTTVTTGNLFGAGTAITIGANTGTTTIRNATTTITGNANINGGTLATSQGTFNLLNTTVTTGNLFGAGTAITIGATTGTTTIRNANTVVTGDLAVNGADITTTATGASSIFNANTTTVNFAQAATTITMGATTGTTTIRNNLAVNGNTTLGDASGDSVTFNSNTVNVPNTVLFTVDDAVNNNISYPVKLQHTTTGTPAIGIGTGVEFITETTNNNNRIGSAIESVSTTVTSGAENFDLVFKTMNAGAIAAERLRITNVGNGILTGNFEIRGGSLTTNQTTFNLINATATTLNIGGAAATFNAGATSGTMTLRNPTIVGSQATQNLFNTTATTLNIGGASTAFNAGATSGTMTLRNPTIVGSQATQNLFNTTATTMNFAGAATAVNIGAATGTTTINNATTSITGNLSGPNDTVKIKSNVNWISPNNNNTITTRMTDTDTLSFSGDSGQLFSITDSLTGTIFAVNDISGVPSIEVIDDGTIILAELIGNILVGTRTDNGIDRLQVAGSVSVSGTINANGGTLATSQTSFNLVNTTATTLNIGGASTAFNAGATSGTMTLRNPTIVGSQTTQNLFDTTATTLNIGGAATAFNAGATSGTMTLRNPTIVGSQATQNLFNTTATTLNIGGAAATFNAGATSGTMTLRNPTIVGSQATQNLFNTTATTMNFAGASTAVTIGATTGTTTIRNASTVVSGTLTVSGNNITMAATNSRDKYRVWNDNQYTIGMTTAFTFGSLNNDYAMTFQMNNADNRGFWWGDTAHTNAQGAMALSTNGKLTVANSIRVGFGETDTVLPGTNYTLEVNGSFAATTKSFVIEHPTKPEMKLRYGSLEGPENGVYVRGRLKDSNVIELPDYWTGLVDPDSITVNLTAIGRKQDLWVDDIRDNTVVVGGEDINCFYTVYAERIDVEKLVVEFNKEQ